MDLNCDMGEIAGDTAVMPFVTSANIACGGHAGDEASMKATVAEALRYRVAVGAHPGYPDRPNFGRLEMNLPPAAISDFVYEQVARLGKIAPLSHVKPHCALYNQAARDRVLAKAIADGVSRWSRDVVMVGLAGSAMLDAFKDAGFSVAAEAFADRRYEPDGSLRSRKFADALITDPEAAAEHAVQLAREGKAQTICIHGDTPGALKIAESVSRKLREAGIELRSFAK